jgi:glycosyltransferase involved in cell wall biosynthesis
MQHPKVSVVIPNYNHARYLCARIDSVLGQTYNDLELLILDDASTDDSHRILARYHSKPTVRILVNGRNSGSAFPQWNRGISLARGEYVWIAESDDAADPRFLETLIPLLDENPHVGLAYCQSRLINKEGRDVGDSLGWTSDLDPERWKSDFINDGRDEVRRYLINKNTIPNASAVIVRRTVLSETLPVDTSFKLCGDWMHWGKVLMRADIAYVAEPLNHWRLESSNSRPLPPGVMEWKEGQRIIEHFARTLGYTESEKTEALLRFAERCVGWSAAHAGTSW